MTVSAMSKTEWGREIGSVLRGRKGRLQCSCERVIREDLTKKMSQELKMVRDKPLGGDENCRQRK